MIVALALSLAVGLAPAASLGQAATTVFKGRPSVKVSEGGIERTPETIARDRAVNLECVISQIGTSYFWASRENVTGQNPLRPSVSAPYDGTAVSTAAEAAVSSPTNVLKAR